MGTFFPHLYEYSKVLKLLEEIEEKKNSGVNQENPKILTHQNLKNFSRNRKRRPKAKDVEKQQNAQQLIIFTPTFDQFLQSNDIKFLVYLELKVKNLRESNNNPLNFCCNLQMETILSTTSSGLSDPKCYEKTDIISINNVYNHGRRNWLANDAVLCVEMAKILPFFSDFDFNDKIEILKDCVLQNVLLTSVYYSFAAFSDTVIFPDGQMPIKYPTFHQHKSQLFGLSAIEPLKRINLTKEEYILLKVLIFCSSKSPLISVKGKKILGIQLTKYSRLLLNFLQAKYGAAPGAVRYSQILSIMEMMTYFVPKIKELYLFMSVLNKGINPTLTLLDQLVIQ